MRNFLRLVSELREKDSNTFFVTGLYKYSANDTKYIVAAIRITTRRFDPSGSSKNKNMILEHATDVMPKTKRRVFFTVRCISLSIPE